MKKQYISLIPVLLLIFFLSCEKKGTASPELILFSDTIDWAWELGEFYGGNSFYWWHNTEKGVFDMGDMPLDCWTGPDDFEHGQFHLRFEIIEQPSNQPFFIQLGFWQDMHAEGGHSETISSRILIRNGKGSLVEAELGSAASWWELQADKAVDFCKVGAFDKIGLALWKAEPLCLPMAQGWTNSQACENPELVAREFFPMKARVTVVAVAAGHSFSGWQNHP